MKYFAKLTATYVAKNKAHMKVQGYALLNDGTLLESDETKEDCLKEFNLFIDQVNAKHKRCNDIKLQSYEFNNLRISVSGNFFMDIYPVKHTKS